MKSIELDNIRNYLLNNNNIGKTFIVRDGEYEYIITYNEKLVVMLREQA